MFRKTMEEYEADTRKKLVIDIREKEAEASFMEKAGYS